MKRIKPNEKVIVNLGRKFKNTRVIALFVEPYEEDKENACVIKPLEALQNQNSPMIQMALRCQLIVDYKQILAKY